MDIAALIEKQRAALDNRPTVDVPVVMAGEVVTVTFAKADQTEWEDLTLAHPARLGTSDVNIGYDQRAVAAAYPRVVIDGDPVEAEQWAEFYRLLVVTHRKNVATALWGLNVYDDIVEAQNLGKAVAAKSPRSPGNRASRRAGSKAASPQK